MPAFECVLVLPFVDTTDVTNFGSEASKRMAARLNSTGTLRAFDHDLLAALLPGLEAGELALAKRELGFELAELLGAETILVGSLSGTWKRARSDDGRFVWVELRLLSRHTREVLWARQARLHQKAEHDSVGHALDLWLVRAATELAEQLHKPRQAGQGDCLTEEQHQALLAKTGGQASASEQPAGASSDPPNAAPAVDTAEAPTTVPPPELQVAVQDESPTSVQDSGSLATESPVASPPAPSEVTTAPPKPAMTPQAVALLIRLKRGSRLPLEGVRFAERQAEIEQLEGETLELLGIMLNAKPELALEFEVHVDTARNPALDRRITEEQAQLLVQRLSETWGVAQDRLTGIGRGSEQPIQPNITRRGREANRRVEVRLRDL